MDAVLYLHLNGREGIDDVERISRRIRTKLVAAQINLPIESVIFDVESEHLKLACHFIDNESDFRNTIIIVRSRSDLGSYYDRIKNKYTVICCEELKTLYDERKKALLYVNSKDKVKAASQLRIMHRYAELMDIDVVGEYVDDSGSSLSISELLLDEIAELYFNCVIVWSPSDFRIWEKEIKGYDAKLLCYYATAYSERMNKLKASKLRWLVWKNANIFKKTYMVLIALIKFVLPAALLLLAARWLIGRYVPGVMELWYNSSIAVLMLLIGVWFIIEYVPKRRNLKAYLADSGRQNELKYYGRKLNADAEEIANDEYSRLISE